MSPKRPIPTAPVAAPVANPDGWIVRMPGGSVIGIAEGLLSGPSGARYVAVRLDRGGDANVSKGRRVLVPFGFVSLGPADRQVILYGLTPAVCALLPVYTGEPIMAHDEAVILWRCVLGTADYTEDEQELGDIMDRDLAQRSMAERSENEPRSPASHGRRGRRRKRLQAHRFRGVFDDQPALGYLERSSRILIGARSLERIAARLNTALDVAGFPRDPEQAFRRDRGTAPSQRR